MMLIKISHRARLSLLRSFSLGQYWGFSSVRGVPVVITSLPMSV